MISSKGKEKISREEPQVAPSPTKKKKKPSKNQEQGKKEAKIERVLIKSKKKLKNSSINIPHPSCCISTISQGVKPSDRKSETARKNQNDSRLGKALADPILILVYSSPSPPTKVSQNEYCIANASVEPTIPSLYMPTKYSLHQIRDEIKDN